MKLSRSLSSSSISYSILRAAWRRSTFKRRLPCQILYTRIETIMLIQILITPCWGIEYFKKKQRGWPIRKNEIKYFLKADWYSPKDREMAEINTWTQSRIIYSIRKGVRTTKWLMTPESVVNIPFQGANTKNKKKKTAATIKNPAPYFMYLMLVFLLFNKYLLTFKYVTTLIPMYMKYPKLWIFAAMTWVEI